MINFFNLSAYGTFDVITPESGEVEANFVMMKAMNGNASVKAQTLAGDHFATNGAYATGAALVIPEGHEIVGRFNKITVTEGVIIAYRYSQVGG